jgi:hypothetical protein
MSSEKREKGAIVHVSTVRFFVFTAVQSINKTNKQGLQIFRCTNDSVPISQSLDIHSFSFQKRRIKKENTKHPIQSALQGFIYYYYKIIRILSIIMLY